MCKSTIDWCEKNYVVSSYIAEYWNTLSGVAIGLSAIYWRVTSDIWVHRGLGNSDVIRNNFVSIYWFLIAVSFGTMLFHSTLLYKYQLLDELPMLMISMCYVRIMSRLYTSRVTFGIVVMERLETLSILGALVVIVVPIAYLVHPILHNIIFHSVLKVFEGLLLLVLYKISNQMNKIVYISFYEYKYNQLVLQDTESSKNTLLYKVQDDIKEYIKLYKDLKRFSNRGFWLYSVSVSLWVLENCFCSQLEFLQFHAWWHVLSSIGVYYLNKVIESHVKIHLLLTEKVKID